MPLVRMRMGAADRGGGDWGRMEEDWDGELRELCENDEGRMLLRGWHAAARSQWKTDVACLGGGVSQVSQVEAQLVLVEMDRVLVLVLVRVRVRVRVLVLVGRHPSWRAGSTVSPVSVLRTLLRTQQHLPNGTSDQSAWTPVDRPPGWLSG